MSKEEVSRVTDAIITAQQSGRRVGVLRQDRLWIMESMFRDQTGGYELVCREYLAEKYQGTQYFSLVHLSPDDIFISL